MKFSSKPVFGTSRSMCSRPSKARYCFTSLSTAEVSRNTSSGLLVRPSVRPTSPFVRLCRKSSKGGKKKQVKNSTSLGKAEEIRSAESRRPGYSSVRVATAEKEENIITRKSFHFFRKEMRRNFGQQKHAVRAITLVRSCCNRKRGRRPEKVLLLP